MPAADSDVSVGAAEHERVTTSTRRQPCCKKIRRVGGVQTRLATERGLRMADNSVLLVEVLLLVVVVVDDGITPAPVVVPTAAAAGGPIAVTPVALPLAVAPATCKFAGLSEPP